MLKISDHQKLLILRRILRISWKEKKLNCVTKTRSRKIIDAVDWKQTTLFLGHINRDQELEHLKNKRKNCYESTENNILEELESLDKNRKSEKGYKSINLT